MTADLRMSVIALRLQGCRPRAHSAFPNASILLWEQKWGQFHKCLSHMRVLIAGRMASRGPGWAFNKGEGVKFCLE